MLSWKIGEVTITRVLEIELPVAYDERYPFLKEATPQALKSHTWLYPHYVTEDGALRLSIHALLVDAPGLKLVVDTCFGNDKPRALLGRQPLATGFLAELERAGWKREAVDTVVCTHLHVDHVGWNTMLQDGRWVPTFPKARYLIGRAEYDYWKGETEGESQEILGDSVQPILDAGLAQFVEPDHVLTAEVRLKPTPGHTPGHVSVLIESQGEKALITGDALHHPCQIAHPDWSPPFDFDKVQSEASRRKLIDETADQPILVIGTHFAAPTAGRIRRDGQAWRLEA